MDQLYNSHKEHKCLGTFFQPSEYKEICQIGPQLVTGGTAKLCLLVTVLTDLRETESRSRLGRLGACLATSRVPQTPSSARGEPPL